MRLASQGKRILVGVLVVLLGTSSGVWAGSAEEHFYRGYYLEQAEGDFAAAAELYGQVVADRRADDRLKSQARTRLAACREELACADFAALMPANTLVYVELNRPGDQLVKLLKQLGLLTGDEQPAVEGGKRVGVSPALVEAVLGIRGAAVAMTGVDPFNQDPTGVLVFHPGDLEVIRGLLESGLPVGGQTVEPIAGFETYNIEGEAFVTLTSRLVIASPQRALIEGVVGRLMGKQHDSLATNPELANALKGRDDSLLYFCAYAKPIMPMINSLMTGAGTQNQEVAIAQAVLDLNSLQTFVGRLGVGEDGLVFDLQLRLDEGHHNLVYNLLRTPPIHRDTLRCVPGGAAGFLVGALNEAPSRFMSPPDTPEGQPPVVTALDFGREIFANIIGFAVYALVPDGEPVPGAPPIPDIAAAITVNDPAKSQALWMQILGIASLASGAGVTEGASAKIEGVTVRDFRFPDGIAVYFATEGNDVLIASTKSAMAQSIQAKRSGRSVLDDPAFAKSLTRLGADTTKALFVHPGRCAQIAKRFMGPAEIAEMKPVVAAMTDTVVSAVVDHSQGLFRVSAMVTGIPDVGVLVGMKLAEEERRHEARARLKHAKQTQDWSEAHQAIETMLAENPGNVDLLMQKFRILAVGMKDRNAALACGEAFFEAAKDKATLLNNAAWALLTEEKLKGRYGDLALKLSQRSNELTKHGNWMFVDTLARAKFQTGRVEEAIKLQKKAIELSNGQGLEEMQAALDRFEKALKGEKPASAPG